MGEAQKQKECEREDVGFKVAWLLWPGLGSCKEPRVGGLWPGTDPQLRGVSLEALPTCPSGDKGVPSSGENRNKCTGDTEQLRP